MKLNLDFYQDIYNTEISTEESEVIELFNTTENFEEALEKDNSINTYIHLSKVKENLLNWYNFKENASGLEIGSGFGELSGLLSEKLEKLISIETSLEKAKFVEKKLNDKDFELIVGTLSNIRFTEKFDYIIITEYLEKNDFYETLEWAKKYLKEDGIFLVAVDNRFGMKNWKGKDNYEMLLGRANKTEYGKNKLKFMIESLGFSNYKFYNIFPEYKAPNIIYTDEHKLTVEDISRNLELNDEQDLNNFSENEVLTQVLSEAKDKMDLFVNSFLIEISKNVIQNNVRYVSFTNYRKDSKQIQTIITKNKVIKKAITEEAKSHIQNIIDNCEHFPQNNCKLLDKKGQDYSIESDFIYGERLDDVIISSSDIIEKFDNFKNVIFQNIVPYENVDKEALLEPLKTLNEEQLKSLNFIEYGFIDMVPKNCFIVGGMNFFFDQEWMLKWIPAEFILFRSIRYTPNIDQGSLYSHYNLNEFLSCFEKLDDYFQDTVLDKNKFKMILRSNDTKRYRLESLQNELADKEAQLMKVDELLEQKDIEIESHIQNAKHLSEVIADRDNQLTIIGNSLSWKITKPIRAISNWIRKICRR